VRPAAEYYYARQSQRSATTPTPHAAASAVPGEGPRPTKYPTDRATGKATSTTKHQPPQAFGQVNEQRQALRDGEASAALFRSAEVISLDEGVEIEEMGARQQYVVNPDDIAKWSWKVVARKAGEINLRIYITTLDRDDPETALIPPSVFQVRIQVREPFSHLVSRLTNNTWTQIGGGATLTSLFAALTAYAVHRHTKRKDARAMPLSPVVGPIPPVTQSATSPTAVRPAAQPRRPKKQKPRQR
jgi:hypothetical protein